MKKPIVAFICVHNSCRSQMAEALAHYFEKETFDAFSAGTELKDRINPDAVEIIKELYGINMEESQQPKLLENLPSNVDIVVTMGCNVSCPHLPSSHREDWGLEDPSGKPRADFIQTAQTIRDKVRDLGVRIREKQIAF